MSALKSEYDAYGLKRDASLRSAPGVVGWGEIPRGVLYPDMDPDAAALLRARELVRMTRLLLSNRVDAELIRAPAISMGGVEGGVDPDEEDGPLSRSIASGSNADCGSLLSSSSMLISAPVDGGTVVVGRRLGESSTTTWTSSKCSSSAWRSASSIPQHE